MLGLVIFLTIGLVLAYAIAVWVVVRRISFPPRKTAAWALAKNRPSDPAELDSPLAFRAFDLELPMKGKVRPYPAWEIDGRREAGPVVIVTPGWGDSRIGALVRIDSIADHASKIIAWDPPGHGDSPGGPGRGWWTKGVREPAMLLHIADEMREAFGKPCVLFGSSAGGGVSVAAAALDAVREESERSVLGVIAEAPYRLAWVPARNVIRLSGYPWAINGPLAFAIMGIIEGVGPGWKGFDRAQLAGCVRVPTLVIHGSADAVCPLADGEAIANAADGKLVTIDGAGHNDLWTSLDYGAQCADAIARYFERFRG